MKALRIPRILRIVAATGSIAVSFSAFGFAASYTTLWAQSQLGPGVLQLAATWSATAIAVVIGQLAAAFLFGRFYCSLLCPLGILQDFLGWIGRRKAQVESDRRKTRLLIALAAFGALAGGWATGFRMFDPFSNFGAISATVFQPAATVLYNLAHPENAKIIRPFSAAMLLTGLVPLALLAALAIWKKRIYCTTICPVGTLLGLCAKYGFFRLHLTDACVQCGRCVKVCPSGCIDPAQGLLDNERCVRCMNCLAACKLRAVRFSSALPRYEEPQPDPARRKFLIGGALTAVGACALGMSARGKDEETPLLTGAAIFPPGAGSAARFAAKCTSCQLCVSNCRGNVLRPAGGGLRAVHLNFDKGMCEFTCNRCTELCPTGALLPLTLKQKQRQRIGLAEFFPSICVAVQDGTDCGACAEHCPTGALRMIEPEPGKRIPHLNAELCIGCGSCEYPCPVRPAKAIRIKPVTIQVQATDPEEYFKKNAPKIETPATDSGDWLV